MRDICPDRESFYLSLYVLYHTPGHVVISNFKDEKIIYILHRYGLNTPLDITLKRYNRESERVNCLVVKG